jgi:serine/threonine protein kinase
MEGGSLKSRLRPELPGSAQRLSCDERFAIASDVARGIDFLHVHAIPPLIHQDVKSDNILLTAVGDRLVAKVADFGTARYAPELLEANTQGWRNTHHSTGNVIGTRPYMPIEYITLGHVSEKTDTYAFGVVLCELLTAEPPADYEQGMVLSAKMVKPLAAAEQLLPPLLDKQLGGDSEWPLARVIVLARVAQHCLEAMPADRCTVSEQVQVLDELAGRAFEACVRTGEKAGNTAGYPLRLSPRQPVASADGHTDVDTVYTPFTTGGGNGEAALVTRNPRLVSNERGVRLAHDTASMQRPLVPDRGGAKR